jgi:hypothetical protein
MGPIIFLKMAENTTGSYDSRFWPKQGEYFNFTRIINNSSNSEYNLAPREYFSNGNFTTLTEDNEVDKSFIAELKLINTDLEDKIGVGSGYPFPAQ